MSSALAGLNQIPGVIGSVIFNAQDECVVHMMPPPFEPVLLGNVMAELRNALNVLSYLDETSSWSAIVVRYDAGYLVVRQLQRTTIMVLAHPSLNPAMLSVGFNVAALKLEKEGLPPAPLPPPPPLPPRPSGAMTSQIPVQTPAPERHSNYYQTPPPPAPQPTHHGVSQSSRDLSMSQSGGVPGIAAVSQSSPRLASGSPSVSGFRSDSQETNPALPDAVGKNVMDGLLRALARHIGPFAKLIMKEELTKLGLTPATLGFGQYEDFINMLSRRVQDPGKRREFMTEAEGLPGRR